MTLDRTTVASSPQPAAVASRGPGPSRPTRGRPSGFGRRLLVWLGAALVAWTVLGGTASPAAADERWQPVADTVTALLQEVPAQYQAGDLKAVEASIRKAYYEHYQASGLEDEIKHRLGAERSKAFQTGVVELRNLTRDQAPQADVEQRTAELVALLAADVAELEHAPEVNDRWSRVAANIIEAIEQAASLYEQGKVDEGLKEATRAYLQHYEADGMEKATLSYLSGRAALAEGKFRDIRVGIRDGAPLEQVQADVAELTQLLTEDAAALDAVSAADSGGWGGFVAALLILLREGVEALLVVAAVVTYVVKTGRRDQLRGVYLGVGAAVAVSIALAWLFTSLTSSTELGLAQELVEGVAGALAVVMLIYISSWILSKSEGDAWHRYITGTVDAHAESGSQWALFTVVFLAVAREGFETILFFVPIFGAAQTPTDHLLIWAGMAAAVVILAVLFIAVRTFGVRLPLRPFFRWTSVLLGLLAVTMAGGAVKEFQDALIVEATPLAGVPQIEWLGLYPTVETIAAQAVVLVIVLGLMVWQFRKSATAKAAPEVNENTEERVETK